MTGMNLEVWFTQQDVVSVYLESSVVDPDEERFLETSLFALFAARQIANFGRDWVGQSLSATLADIDPASALADVTSRLGDVRLASEFSGSGRKGFTAELRPEKRGFFKLKIHGMGFMGKGAGYYGPTATLCVLAHLLGRRTDDPEYQYAVAATAKFVGLAGMRGAIGVTSQAPIAMEAAAAGWTAAQDEGDESLEMAEPAMSDSDEESDGYGRDPMRSDFDELLTKTPIVKRVGEAVDVVDADEVPVRFRVISVVDPADPTTDEFGPDRGHRYVGVELKIENLSADEHAFLALTTALTDDEDQPYELALAVRKPELDVVSEIEPRSSVTGWALFELHRRAQPKMFLVGIDDTPLAVGWLFPASEEDSNDAADRVDDDAVERIRRLAALRDDGLITEEEFEAKKAELLDRY